MARKELTLLLNTLLMEIEDGKKGFALAAEECEAPELKPILMECSHDCTRSLHDLQQAVQSFSEPATQHGSVAGAVRHGWTRVKSNVAADSTLAALDDVEREYARIETAFEAALEADLPQAVRSVVERERDRMRRNPERLAEVRSRYQQEHAAP
jgi:uncharacterized protein (TIGR02284 family)